MRFPQKAREDGLVEARRSLRWVLSNVGKMVWADQVGGSKAKEKGRDLQIFRQLE